MSLRVAIFDVDETLVAGSSGGTLLTELWRRGVFTYRQKRLVASTLVRRRVGMLPAVSIVELGSRMLGGLAVADVAVHARAIVAERLARLVYRDALGEIALARLRGMRVILASGAPAAIVEPLGEHVGADLAIGSRAVVRDGRYTHEVLRPLPYKQGKRDLVLAALAGEPVDWARSSVFSDLAIDVPLLERAGRAVAVNPRGSLKRIALERGWEVQRWRRRAGLAHG